MNFNAKKLLSFDGVKTPAELQAIHGGSIYFVANGSPPALENLAEELPQRFSGSQISFEVLDVPRIEISISPPFADVDPAAGSKDFRGGTKCEDFSVMNMETGSIVFFVRTSQLESLLENQKSLLSRQSVTLADIPVPDSWPGWLRQSAQLKSGTRRFEARTIQTTDGRLLFVTNPFSLPTTGHCYRRKPTDMSRYSAAHSKYEYRDQSPFGAVQTNSRRMLRDLLRSAR